MNNKLENLLKRHITKLQADIKSRDADSAIDRELDKIDAQNIASLREARAPLYNDHLDCLLGDEEYPMPEFAGLSEA